MDETITTPVGRRVRIQGVGHHQPVVAATALGPIDRTGAKNIGRPTWGAEGETRKEYEFWNVTFVRFPDCTLLSSPFQQCLDVWTIGKSPSLRGQ
jgi:hypothetical protein